jgi:arsenate reductase-like glutaredoxin family protein
MMPVRELHQVEESRLDEHLAHLKKCVNGGVSLDRALTREEAALEILQDINEIIKRPIITTHDGSLNSTDAADIKRELKLFFESYK